MGETARRRTAFLSGLRELEGCQGELEGEPFRSMGNHLVAQYVSFSLGMLYLLAVFEK